MRFRDRSDAGRRLAERLRMVELAHPVVVALPRGGVPVAAPVAAALGAPLDVIVVRKIGHPRERELALGAIGEGGTIVLDRPLIQRTDVEVGELRDVVAEEEVELARRVDRYRRGRRRVPLAGRTVILVDDGLATGSTARAAVEVLRRMGAGRIVLAVPVAPADVVGALARTVEVVCLEAPRHLGSVGEWYDDFAQVSDAEVLRLLSQGAAVHPDAHVPLAQEVAVGPRGLPGSLVVPDGARGLILFAHGSGSSHTSPRNHAVAQFLNQAGFATLLFDLLNGHEDTDRRNVFDVRLLAGRLVGATAWCRTHGLVLPLGYFGASTGAAAALVAAAEHGSEVQAVVARGGRPDLAVRWLRSVTAPTLLVVGADDDEVLRLNRSAARQLVACEHRLAVVPGATHLFEEPGALQAVASLASEWFGRHLAPAVGAIGARPEGVR
jgi:predicted phosphoribosyltransferase/pimeloyl-ACP methyl ester carboxylesterase